MTATTEDAVGALVAGTYLAFAEQLGGLPTERWDAASLCEAWRVREVVAHLTMAARYTGEQFMELLRAEQFDFTRLSDRLAAQDGQLPRATLVENLEDPTLHAWIPPGGSVVGALNHVVIHSLDVTVPLGLPSAAGDDALRLVLDDLTHGGVHAHFGTQLEGRRFTATDLDWSYGSGAELAAPAGELAVVICGRDREVRQRPRATNAHTSSTTPKGHVPARNP